MANLIDNAVWHNVPDGYLRVITTTTAGRAQLAVTNTGPTIRADQLDRLRQPFQRLATDRTADDRAGHGLGLSIVAAIATAHDAVLTLDPLPGGGLTVRVGFVSLAVA